MKDDIVVVPQHPEGRTLELAFGAALNYNERANRLQHNANTESGSSGSPCLTASLEPFGLHHAGGLDKNFLHNQCIPLRPIIQRMVRQHVEPFWQV